MNGQVTTGAIIRAIDTSRRLVYFEGTTVTGGMPQTSIELYSENDAATYISENGVCNETTDSDFSTLLYTDNWDRYAAGTESPVGTFTSTSQSGVTRQLTIVNGVPAVFTTTTSTAVTVIMVTNFEMPPPFSTFSLPTECSNFTCTACYS